MLFDKNDERTNERVLYKTKPNMILGCKKAIIGVFLLAIVFIVSPRVIQFIGELQVYLISRIQLPLTRYTAIAFFVVILVIIVYIIWQLIGWYSLEYTLTDTRIMIKSGILSSKKNYMPYTTIQDINTSQSVFARMFNVGTVSAFSAYDNNQIRLENISDPSKVEEIIFNHMMGYRDFQEPSRGRFNRSSNRRPYVENSYQSQFSDRRPYVENGYQGDFSDRRPYVENGYQSQFSDRRSYVEDSYHGDFSDERPYVEDSYQAEFSDENDYYDEYEPITPISHERQQYQRREYEYYPEDFAEEKSYPSYEYEPYDDEFEYNMNRVSNDRFDNPRNDFDNGSYYDKGRVDYSPRKDDYYQNNDSENYYDEVKDYSHKNEDDGVDEITDTSETVIRRHFDKFKK